MVAIESINNTVLFIISMVGANLRPEKVLKFG